MQFSDGARIENTRIVRGADKLLRVSTTKKDGSVLNLQQVTGVTWGLSRTKATTVLISKTLGNGVEITDRSAGEMEITIDEAETEPLRGQYYHECWLADGAGVKNRVFWGHVYVDSALLTI